MSELVIYLRLLFGLTTGVAAALAHTGLLRRHVRCIDPAVSLPAGGSVAAAGLLRVTCAAALLALGVRLGLGPALAALSGFWLARMYWLWHVAFGRQAA